MKDYIGSLFQSYKQKGILIDTKILLLFKVIPRIGDEKKRIPEEKALLDLW